ncbi:unnamed protein product [Prorocentrum cordatum]|uniref:Uncharacterized protein n=1 Tax=Prorocentrum cordatum TaxID=2364126 RepID=A0ABN9S3F2_9DINO|nr:unnamed protein product [Polarella glacialis]
MSAVNAPESKVQKATQGAQPTAAATPAKRPADDITLLEKEDADAKSSTKDKKPARTFEAAVKKALQDNFVKKGWDLKDLDLIERDGETIRQRAKATQHETGEPIGKYFYEDLRNEFKEDTEEKKMMTVDDPSQPQDALIYEALDRLYSARMDTSGFEAIFEQRHVPPNQKNAKAMFSAFLDVPVSTEKGSDFLIAATAYINDTRLHITYAKLWNVVKEHMDKALEKNFALMKNSGLSQGLWLETHAPYLPIVADALAIEKCIHNKTSWSDVQDELERACQSHCGNRIFSKKLAGLCGVAIRREIRAAIEELEKEKIIQQAIDKTIKRIKDYATARGKDINETASTTENVVYKYRYLEATTKVYSLYDEAMSIIMGIATTRGVRLGLIKPLRCEAEIAPVGDEVENKGVDAGLLKAAGTARKAALEFCKGGFGADIKAMLVKKHKQLSKLYKYWHVDRDFWMSVVGEAGKKRVEDTVVAACPSVQRDIKAKEVVAALENFEKTKLYEFAGTGSHTFVTEVLKVARALAGGRAPVWPNSNAEGMARVKEAMGALCRFAAASGAADAERVLVGKEAMNKLIEAATAKKESGTALDYDDLGPLRKYTWLLDSAQKTIADKWLSEVVGVAAPAAPAAKQKGSSAKKAALEKEKQGSKKRKLDALFK